MSIQLTTHYSAWVLLYCINEDGLVIGRKEIFLHNFTFIRFVVKLTTQYSEKLPRILNQIKSKNNWTTQWVTPHTFYDNLAGYRDRRALQLMGGFLIF